MGEHPRIVGLQAEQKGYEVPFGCLVGFEVDGKFIPAEVYVRRGSEQGASTLGERRVGYTFNPSGSVLVDYTKILAANRIDALEASRTDGYSEKNRTISRAQTAVEDACMLAVKSIFQ